MALFVIRTEEEFKVIGDPFRMKIIHIMSGFPEQMGTSKQIADALGENSSKVSYHLKMLLKIGVIELDHIEVVNGINAKYFKLLFDSFDTQFDVATDLDLDVFHHSYMGLFSGAVNTFLDELKELRFEKDKKYQGVMSYEKIWLTKEEFEAVNEYIYSIVEKHKTKELADGEAARKKFLFFSALMQTNDEDGI